MIVGNIKLGQQCSNSAHFIFLITEIGTSRLFVDTVKAQNTANKEKQLGCRL